MRIKIDNSTIWAVVCVCMYFGLLCYAVACFSVITEETIKRDEYKEFSDRIIEFEDRVNKKEFLNHSHRYHDGSAIWDGE